MSIRDMDLDEYEVIMRFPAPPPSFEHEDTPDEVALVRIPNTADGVMICGRLESKPWHNPKQWIANFGERAAVRHLLAEVERLTRERDEARKAARWLGVRATDEGHEIALQRWPWLESEAPE